MMALLVLNVWGTICDDTPNNNEQCEMVTPPITCTTYNYTIYQNFTINQTGNLQIYDDDLYYFNFTKSNGEYIIKLCDGTYREIFVGGDEKMIIATIIGLLGIIAFLIVLWLKLDDSHKIFKTFLILFTIYLTALIPRALNVFINNALSWDFMRYYLLFLKIFGWYLLFYFIWSVADYYQKTTPLKQWFNDNFKNKGGR